MGLIKSLFKFGFITTSLSTIVVIVSLILVPPPQQVIPKDFSLPSNIKFEGVLESNDALSMASKLYENQLVGPESFALYQGDLYTGTADGLIIKFRHGSDLKVIAHIGDDTGCRYSGQRWRLSECGRPLGLRFDSKGSLYVLDAYHGIKKVDIKTGYVELVCNVKQQLELIEKQSKSHIFIDDFVISETLSASNETQNEFYISDASSKWPLEFVNHVVLDSDTSGRILKCSESSGKVEIIDTKLRFPNGLELSPEKDAILVNELNERQILKYFINGPKRGLKQVLSVNLPGFPDNIKLSSRLLSSKTSSDEKDNKKKESSAEEESYWVALYEGFDSNHVNPLYKLVSFVPQIVTLTTNGLHNLGLIIQKIGLKLDSNSIQQVGYEIKSMIIWQKIHPTYGLIVKINSKGEIIKSLHSPSGTINHLSEVYQVKEDGKNVLYLGSYFNNYIGRLVID